MFSFPSAEPFPGLIPAPRKKRVATSPDGRVGKHGARLGRGGGFEELRFPELLVIFVLFGEFRHRLAVMLLVNQGIPEFGGVAAPPHLRYPGGGRGGSGREPQVKKL